MELLQEILEEVRAGRVADKASLQKLKLRAVRAHKAARFPTDTELLNALPPGERERFRPLLRIKATRTLSGVAVVTVQASPDWCPHGTCTYCPGGPPSNSAKSYTGFEPAALRAGRNRFDPYDQTADRLQQLQEIGHPTDKVDLIIQGGTFTARDADYQQWFVKRCYDAMNDDGLCETNRLGLPGALTLEEALRRNETAANRCIGLTIETKPDWARERHLDTILEFGATRLELGVQTTHEDLLGHVHRGHTLQDTIDATQLAKDAGFKLVYHMMPGLPGSDPGRDIESFRRIFEDADFRPDMLKIYPTLVLKGTALYEEWRRGEFQPYDTATAASVVAEAKRLVPRWVRIQRVDRDIPVPMIEAGVDKSNLREIALRLLRERTGQDCRCIRCREVGFRERRRSAAHEPQLRRDAYDASGGREYFLAYEDPATDDLVGYLRLRVPSRPHRPELRGAPHAMVRELKINGQMVPLGEGAGGQWQHRGYGRRLLEEAVRISFEELGLSKLSVISGVGVKPYYRRLGFIDDGVYVSLARAHDFRP